MYIVYVEASSKLCHSNFFWTVVQYFVVWAKHFIFISKGCGRKYHLHMEIHWECFYRKCSVHRRQKNESLCSQFCKLPDARSASNFDNYNEVVGLDKGFCLTKLPVSPCCGACIIWEWEHLCTEDSFDHLAANRGLCHQQSNTQHKVWYMFA